MSQCQRALDRAGYLVKATVTGRIPLNSDQAIAARAALRTDGGDWLYSALISLADSLHGLQVGLYTWATVKLYYSVFYTARANLSMDDHALVYMGSSPFVVTTRAGQNLSKTKGNTHTAVLAHYVATFPHSFFLSQNIGTDLPLVWLTNRREEANYKWPRAAEPQAPDHFKYIAEIGIRKALAAYLGPDWKQYIFDPDHAMLAFPLLFWRETLLQARHSALPEVIANETSFLNEILKDSNGSYSTITSLLEIRP